MKIRDIIDIINKNANFKNLIEKCKDSDLAEYNMMYEDWLDTDLNIETIINNNYNTYNSEDILCRQPNIHKPSFDINKPMC